MRFFLPTLFFLMSFFALVDVASAAGLTWVSDLISTSEPGGLSTSHTITLTPSISIPVGGSIVITPDASAGGAFDIQTFLDYTDLDLATAPTSTGPYTDRTLAAVASPTEEGVAVVSGAAGKITITLGSSGIAAADVVRINVGSVATVDAVGDQYITSPLVLGSHHIRIETYDAGSTRIEYGSTVVVMVAPVTVGRVDTTDNVPPIRSNGLPSGLLPGSTQNVFVSLNTDKTATCRYATTTGVDYYSMLSSTIFTTANQDTLHYQNIPVTTNTIYRLYIRCQKYTNTPNQDDYDVNFEIGMQPGTSTPATPPGPTGPSGSGGGGGAGGPYLGGGDVTIEGEAVPLSTLVILKDGVITQESPVSVLGKFSQKFTSLPRGAYTWSAYIRDGEGRRSSTYSSTIYLLALTNNVIAPVYLSPTMSAASTTIPVGESLRVRGYAIALSQVQVIMNRQGNSVAGKIISATTTANGNGSWSLVIPTAGLEKGTYEAKASSQLADRDHSLLSPIVYIGIGENPNPDFSNRSDLNKDGKVNLIDFSILLFNWKGSDAVSDINQDGTVNLTDFSIMLANWTG